MILKEKKEISKIIYRAKLAKKNLDMAIYQASKISHLLPEEVEKNLRDARQCIIQARILIRETGEK